MLSDLTPSPGSIGVPLEGYRSFFSDFIAMAAFGCPVLEKFGCHPKIFGGEIRPDRQSGDCARRNSFFSLISVRMAATELHLTGIAEVAAVKVFEGEEKKPELLAADAAGPHVLSLSPSDRSPRFLMVEVLNARPEL